MTKRMIYILLCALFSMPVHAKLVKKEIIYPSDSVVCRGHLVYDGKVRGKRPGVLLVHEWWGLNDFARTQAERLAELGYTVLAADMYGNGRTTTDAAMASKMAGEVRGTPLIRERALAGLKTLLGQGAVDPGKIAAIGFCFGGTTVLELAYSGAPIKGAVSFHGGIVSPGPGDLGNIKAKFLVLHGADDPNVPPEAVARFQESMRKAGADWQMIYHGNAVHSFTNPAAGNDNSKGAAYNPLAAARSWNQMRLFLEELFP